MQLWSYLSFLERAETTLATSYEFASEGHRPDADVHFATAAFGRQAREHAAALSRVLAEHDTIDDDATERLHVVDATPTRTGDLALLRDLMDLLQLATLVDAGWSLARQAALASRNGSLVAVIDDCAPVVGAQVDWLHMRLRATAPQALLVTTPRAQPASSGTG